MEVELDVFSGRPNPKWELNTGDTRKLQTKLDSLTEQTTPAADPGLGYRGFVLRGAGRTWRVFQGRVGLESPGPVITYRDTPYVEVDLINQAKSQGYGDLIPSH